MMKALRFQKFHIHRRNYITLKIYFNPECERRESYVENKINVTFMQCQEIFE